jgi:hypothetical protein
VEQGSVLGNEPAVTDGDRVARLAFWQSVS